MKRFLFIVFIGVLAFFSMREKTPARQDPLYKLLAEEDWKSPADREKQLSIIVGMDYIPYKFIELFEDLTGIKVTVDIFDSNEILEAKLLAGGAQYDLVFPTAWPNFSRQLQAKIYAKLDKKKIDIKAFDADIMQRLAKYDKDNEHALPFQFGISGIGINEAMIDKLIPNAPKNSLALIFDPKNAAKLSRNRISVYESSDELFPALLAYLGLDPETEDEDDIRAAAKHLEKIRKYIAKFTSFGFEDLASGNACVALSTSGDVIEVRRNDANKNIKFFAPKEGTPLWVDVAAIPQKAQHINNAHLFLKFLFHPRVIAEVTNTTSRANAVVAANKYVSPELINNPDIYPPEKIRAKCYTERPVSPRIEALKTQLLTIIKSMRN